MPFIPPFKPRLDQSGRYTPGVEFNPRQAGKPEDALIQLGGTVANVVQEIQEKRLAADANTYAFESATQDSLDFQKAAEDMRLNAGNDGGIGKDYTGYAEKMQQWLTDRFEQRQKEAPSEVAKQAYVSRSGGMFQNGMTGVWEMERKAKTEYHDTILQKRTDEMGHAISNAAHSHGSAVEYLKQAFQYVDDQTGKVWNKEQAAEKKRLMGRQIALAWLEGIDSTKNPEDYQRAINLLVFKSDSGPSDKPLSQRVTDSRKLTLAEALDQNKITQAEYKKFKAEGKTHYLDPVAAEEDRAGLTANGELFAADFLTPVEKANYIEQFRAAIKANAHVDMKSIEDRLHTDNVYRMNTGKDDPRQWTLLAERYMKQVDPEGKTGPTIDEASNALVDKLTATAVGNLGQQLKQLPRSQREAFLKGAPEQAQAMARQILQNNPSLQQYADKFMEGAAGDQSFGYMLAKQGESMLQSKINEIDSEQEKDPVAYVMENYPGVKKYAARGDLQGLITSAQAAQAKLEIPESKRQLLDKETMFKHARAITAAEGNPQLYNMKLTQLQQAAGQYGDKVIAEMVKKEMLPKAIVDAMAVDPNDRHAREMAVADVVNRDKIKKAYLQVHDPKDASELMDETVRQTETLNKAYALGSSFGGGLNAIVRTREAIHSKAMALQVQDASLSDEEAVKKAAEYTYRTRPPVDLGSRGAAIVPVKYRKDYVVNFAQALFAENTMEDMGVAVPTDSPIKEKAAWFRYIHDNGKLVSSEDDSGLYLMYYDNAAGKNMFALDGNKQRIFVSYPEIQDFMVAGTFPPTSRRIPAKARAKIGERMRGYKPPRPVGQNIPLGD